MKILIQLTVVLLLFASCKTGDSVAKAEAAKQTKALVENSDYEITLDWARPLQSAEMVSLGNSNLLPFESRSGRINIVGSSSHVTKKGDSVSVYLPYFGTRQMAPKFINNNDVAIQFDGIPKDYKLTYNEKKGISEVNFKIKEGSEKYNVYLAITPAKRATVRVYSSQRTMISYTGLIDALVEEEVDPGL